MLVNPYSSQNTSGDNYEEALTYMDKILLFAPDYGDFRVNDLVKKLEPDFKKAEPIRNLQSEIDRLLTKTFNYASRPTPTQIPISLTEHGRFVKSQGGHFAYLKKLEIKEADEVERQKLSDEKLVAEVDIAKFQRGLGKRLTKWGFVVAFISVVASVLTTPFVSNRIDKQQDFSFDTASLKMHLQKLEQRIQKLEQQKRIDTVPMHQ